MDAFAHTNVNLLFGSERFKKNCFLNAKRAGDAERKPGFNVRQPSDRKNGTNGDILADFKRPGGRRNGSDFPSLPRVAGVEWLKTASRRSDNTLFAQPFDQA
jgi:hypothetical protein